MKRYSIGLIDTEDELLGKNIYYLRKKKGLSQRKLAALVEIDLSNLYRLEKKQTGAIFEKPLANICEFFNLTQEELIFTDLQKIAEEKKRQRQLEKEAKQKKGGE